MMKNFLIMQNNNTKHDILVSYVSTRRTTFHQIVFGVAYRSIQPMWSFNGSRRPFKKKKNPSNLDKQK